MFSRTSALLCSALLVLTVTGCGNGEEKKATENLSKSLSQGGNKQFQLTESDADCIAERLVDELGVDRLKKSGLLTEDLEVDEELGSMKMEKKDADTAAKAITGCTDMEERYEQVLTASAQVDAATKKCVTDVITEDVAEKVLAGEFRGDSKVRNELLMKPLMECAKKAS